MNLLIRVCAYVCVNVCVRAYVCFNQQSVKIVSQILFCIKLYFERFQTNISNVEHFAVVLKRLCVCSLVKRKNRTDLQWLEGCKNQTTNEYSVEKEAELIE